MADLKALNKYMKVKQETFIRKAQSSILTPSTLETPFPEGTAPPPSPTLPPPSSQEIIASVQKKKGWAQCDSDDEYGGSTDEECVTNSSSKMSNSRPANQRGPKRRQQNKDRLIAYKKKMNPDFQFQVRALPGQGTAR